jgi:PAS domain S-box-containing protein
VLYERVLEIVRANSALTADAAIELLRTRLETVYPNVDVRRRADLAGFGTPALYVLRDGRSVSDARVEAWITENDVARVVTDATGQYVEANRAAEELFGVEQGEVIGRHAGDFTRPDARVDGEALWQTLQTRGRLHSMALLVGPHNRRVEFVTIADGDGPGRNVTYLRELAVVIG